MSRKVRTYGGASVDTHPAVWAHLEAEAIEHKAWATGHEHAADPSRWRACSMSQDMLRERLDSSVEALTEYAYRYLHHRAHLRPQGGARIDPVAARLWHRLTGEWPEYAHSASRGEF